MANEFVARNGIVARDTSTISGSLLISGSVGIGTSSPQSTLDVSGSGTFSNGLLVTGSIINNGVNIQNLSIAYAIALG